ncbi:unnamed protein product [Acanthosepion pharaonis]|uniref:Uncharacterized protein n=1 Tax=Acanthosepion pharaonis TaxID=158019 RepID=A0A812CRT8_ACAPH|nr:unnamed protein product [Sepia pharaonis]
MSTPFSDIHLVSISISLASQADVCTKPYYLQVSFFPAPPLRLYVFLFLVTPPLSLSLSLSRHLRYPATPPLSFSSVSLPTFLSYPTSFLLPLLLPLCSHQSSCSPFCSAFSFHVNLRSSFSLPFSLCLYLHRISLSLSLSLYLSIYLSIYLSCHLCYPATTPLSFSSNSSTYILILTTSFLPIFLSLLSFSLPFSLLPSPPLPQLSLRLRLLFPSLSSFFFLSSLSRHLSFYLCFSLSLPLQLPLLFFLLSHSTFLSLCYHLCLSPSYFCPSFYFPPYLPLLSYSQDWENTNYLLFIIYIYLSIYLYLSI